MSLFIYIARALALLRCCVSESQRNRVRQRWNKTPAHHIVYEVGTAMIGLAFVGALIAAAIVNS